MDLASAPGGPVHAPVSAEAAGGSVRLLGAAQASTPIFMKQWEELVSEAAEPNPFFEPWFALPSFKHCADGTTILARFEGEHLTGLLPVKRRNSYYGYPVPHLSSWLHDNAFCGIPLVKKGCEHAFWRDLFAHFDRAPGAALFAHLPELSTDGPLAAALDDVLVATGRLAVTVENGTRAMLASDLDPHTYLVASMSAKKRKELRRQHKRLSEEGVLTVERRSDAESIAEWVAEFLDLESAGWKGKAGSALSSARSTGALFTDALTNAAHAGRLERLSLNLNGSAIAMLATFLTPPGAFGFKTAFDERYARYSPGLLLQVENLALLDRPEIEWCDSCAAPGHSMIERIWREKRRITTRNVAIGGPLRRATFRLAMAYETRGKSAS